jgi:hypothetical protein
MIYVNPRDACNGSFSKNDAVSVAASIILRPLMTDVVHMINSNWSNEVLADILRLFIPQFLPCSFLAIKRNAAISVYDPPEENHKYGFFVSSVCDYRPSLDNQIFTLLDFIHSCPSGVF